MADFSYDPATLRFRAPSGRFIPQPSVDELFNDALARAARDVRALTEQMRAGTLAIQDWQVAVARDVKQATLAATALGKGGWDNLTLADEGAAAARIAEQHAYLQRFAGQLANGELPLDGRLARRAELYVQQANVHYQNTRAGEMAVQGYTRVQNVLTANESCDGCIAAAELGWVDVADMPAIGTRDCGPRCKCQLQFRQADGTRSA